MYRVEDYPQIRNNYLLTGRNVGASRKLRGDVGVIVCYMKRSPADFPETAVSQFRDAMYDAFNWLEQEAKKRGVPLNIKSYRFDVDIPKNADPQRVFGLIRDFLSQQTMEATQNHYERTLNLDEAPFILAFDEDGRSFAANQNEGHPYRVDEYSAIFRWGEKYYWTTIAHELLHQFGAVDYYYPDSVKERALQYFGDSVMGIGRTELDDLTAYLIGWKDTISAETYWFLRDTMWITRESYEAAITAAWKK